jgi:hypothetical protein
VFEKPTLPDDWLLGATEDARRQATVLNLLDLAHAQDGPIAQSVLPFTLRLGVHGNFRRALPQRRAHEVSPAWRASSARAGLGAGPVHRADAQALRRLA